MRVVSADIRDSAMLTYLQRSPEYLGKLMELRAEVSKWLTHTTASFTHYTSHTVEHSDEIIRQLSNLLFDPTDPRRPVVDLTGAEVYVLCASAFLHDAGMVISDGELREILDSDAWADWLAKQPSARDRLDEIEEFRAAATPPDRLVRHLIADRQMRYLILDFVRGIHHRRSAQFLKENQAALGRFGFDDPVLVRTIAAVCLAHGLASHELEDRDQFPEQRDIRGEKVNVRFCALLLRIGDLLDMSHDRACPLVLNAVSPLPAESIAHWTQYQRITHRATSPDRIELTAECETQDEHRYLHDWCSWLVTEIATARGIMSRATRHAQWNPPAASISSGGSIVIRPSESATYVAVDWRLQLDPEAVFSRLIHDIDTEPAAFIRELLQNSLDATRCHMYERMAAAGIDPPTYPQHADASWREALPISVTRSTTTRFNEMSQEHEERDIIVVEDLGIGMDRDIILKYLLQVGRSYYTSEEFARRYPFVPTSRFGVGFLSVFNSADEVRVVTRRSGSDSSEGIALTLKGPRSYVLTERAERQAAGTRVEVVLRRPINIDLTETVTAWCRRVEFPILVTDGGKTADVHCEEASDFIYEEPSVLADAETMGVRAFPISADGIEGEIYVFYRRTPRGESWTDYKWATYTYPTKHPEARPPRLPAELACFHGISLYWGGTPSSRFGVSARLDYRRHLDGLSLSRSATPFGSREQLGLQDHRVHERLVDLVRTHIGESDYAQGPAAWRYKQTLIEATGLDEFWLDEPGTLQVVIDGEAESRSLRDVCALEKLSVAVHVPLGIRRHLGEWNAQRKAPPPPPRVSYQAIAASDVDDLASPSCRYLFGDRSIVRAEWLDDELLLVVWAQDSAARRVRVGYRVADAVAIPGVACVSVRIHKAFDEVYDHAILNTENGVPPLSWTGID